MQVSLGACSHRFAVQPNIQELPFRARFWACVLVVGILVGLSAAGLMALLQFVQHTVWSYHAGVFLDGVDGTPGWRRVATLTAAGVFGGIAMWLIGRWYGWKAIDVDGSIWKGTGKLPFLQGSAVAVVSMTLVGLGMSLGRERSVKQAGALFASKIAELAKLDPGEWRVLTALGSAAGMAAVYNMPIGGALYGLEVLLGSFSLRLVLPALALGGIATFVSWIVLPSHPTYSVPNYQLWLPQVLWALIAAPVFGVFSSLYIRLIAFAQTHKARKNQLLFVPIPIFIAAGVIAIAYPQVLGNGKDVVQYAFTGSMTIDLVMILTVARPLCMAGFLTAGMPGGLFTPTLTFGALLGTVLGAAWSSFWPGAPIGSYAIIGAGALVGAATQGPLSSIVMLTELTGAIDPLIVPLAIATAGAAVVSRRLIHGSIYSMPSEYA